MAFALDMPKPLASETRSAFQTTAIVVAAMSGSIACDNTPSTHVAIFASGVGAFDIWWVR